MIRPSRRGCSAFFAGVLIALAGCSSNDKPASPSVEPRVAKGLPEQPAPARPPTPAPEPCAGLQSNEDPPLALVLARSSNNRIDAVFCSTSAKPQRVLVPGGCGQRVDLQLEHESNGVLDRYDGLSARGCSGRVLSTSFRELPAGEHFVAAGGTLAPTDDAYELRFGALHFQRVPRGRITLRAEFISRTDRSDDKGRIDNVWLGRLEAAPLVVELGAP